MIYQVEGLSKSYGAYKVLDQVCLEVFPRSSVAIMGPSGSGKSTLLHCLGGVDRADQGSLLFEGNNLQQMGEEPIASLRRERIASIFQFFYLLPTLTVSENIAFPLMMQHHTAAERNERVQEMMQAVAMDHRAQAYPNQLSGGEQQRVAIARALIMRPSVVLADEPTGNLDRKNGESILELMQQLITRQSSTLILVTHSKEAAAVCRSLWFMEDGQLHS